MVTREDTREITKIGVVKQYNTTCKECGTEYKYTSIDVKSGKITCPLCYTIEYHKTNTVFRGVIRNKPTPPDDPFDDLPWNTVTKQE